MSETETISGKIRLIAPTIEEAEKFANEKLEGKELPSYYKNYLEMLVYDLDDKYVKIGNKLYEVIEKKDLSESDIFEAKKINETDLDFLVQYYNGGCSFGEALEYAIKKMEQSQSA